MLHVLTGSLPNIRVPHYNSTKRSSEKGSGICGDVNALSSIRQGLIIWNLGPFSGAVLLVEEFGRGL